MAQHHQIEPTGAAAPTGVGSELVTARDELVAHRIAVNARRAAGRRRTHERKAVTVYYNRDGHSVAYTIVGGSPLPEPGGAVMVLNRYRLHTWAANGRTIVTWRRKGHTCVLSATGVPATMLQHLAAWRPPTVTA